MSSAPATLLEAVIHFANYENCNAFMMNLRWPKGKVSCPRCGSTDVDYLPNARVFKCYQKHDRQKFSLKVGTIFEDSPIALEKWLPVMWMLTNCKNGVSSWEIHRAIKVTQKTAWFMLQRIRLGLQDDETGGQLSGHVEVDETLIGGKARNMHKTALARRVAQFATPRTGRNQTTGKVAVMGLLERHGEVRTMVVEGTKRRHLHREVVKHVEAGSTVYSDALRSYSNLSEQYIHNVINHAEKYVEGNVHTNGLENFWSCLKRTIGGTYISVESFHLFRYLDRKSVV